MTDRQADARAAKLLDPEKWYGTLWHDKRAQVAYALKEAYSKGVDKGFQMGRRRTKCPICKQVVTDCNRVGA